MGVDEEERSYVKELLELYKKKNNKLRHRIRRLVRRKHKLKEKARYWKSRYDYISRRRVKQHEARHTTRTRTRHSSPLPPPRRSRFSSIIFMTREGYQHNLYILDLHDNNRTLEPFCIFPEAEVGTIVSYYHNKETLQLLSIGGSIGSTNILFSSRRDKPLQYTNMVYSLAITDYHDELALGLRRRQWTLLPQRMILPRFSPKVLVIDSRLFVFGGICGNSSVSNFHPFHWAEVLDLEDPDSRWEALSVPLHDMLGKPHDHCFRIASYTRHRIIFFIEEFSSFIFDTRNNSLVQSHISLPSSISSTFPFYIPQPLPQLRNYLYHVYIRSFCQTVEAVDVTSGRFFSSKMSTAFPNDDTKVNNIFTLDEFPDGDCFGLPRDYFVLPHVHCDPFSVASNPHDPVDELYVLMFSKQSHDNLCFQLICRRLHLVCGSDGKISVLPVSTTTYQTSCYSPNFVNAFCVLDD